MPHDLKFIISGTPIAWKRARLCNSRFFDEQKKIKHDYTLQLQAQNPTKVIFSGPVELELTFFFPIPKSLSSPKQNALRFQPHHVRPDIDNCCKLILDIANEFLFKDDACVASLIARKVYDDFPRTELLIRELK